MEDYQENKRQYRVFGNYEWLIDLTIKDKKINPYQFGGDFFCINVNIKKAILILSLLSIFTCCKLSLSDEQIEFINIS